jgi:hypothetical protein
MTDAHEPQGESLDRQQKAMGADAEREAMGAGSEREAMASEERLLDPMQTAMGSAAQGEVADTVPADESELTDDDE